MDFELALNVLTAVFAAGTWVACSLELRKILHGDGSSIRAGRPDRTSLVLPLAIGVIALGAVVPRVSSALIVLGYLPLALLFAFREGIRFQRAQATSDHR